MLECFMTGSECNPRLLSTLRSSTEGHHHEWRLDWEWAIIHLLDCSHMSKHQMEHGDFYDPLMVRVRCSHTWSNVLAPNTGAGCMNVSAGNRRRDDCGPGCWCEEPLENVATSMWLVAPSRPCHPVPVWGAVCRLRHVPVFVLPLVSSCSVSRPRGLHLVSPPMLLAGAATGSTTSGYKIILTVQIMGAPSSGCLMINESKSKCFVGNLCPSQNIETWELASQFGNLCLCNTYR